MPDSRGMAQSLGQWRAHVPGFAKGSRTRLHKRQRDADRGFHALPRSIGFYGQVGVQEEPGEEDEKQAGSRTLLCCDFYAQKRSSAIGTRKLRSDHISNLLQIAHNRETKPDRRVWSGVRRGKVLTYGFCKLR